MADKASNAHADLTPEEQRILERFREYQRTRSLSLRDALVLEHASLVEKLARQFLSSGESVDDLVQEGYIGLIKAVERFEPDKGIKFSTYATHIISGEIRHYLRDRGKLIQEPGWHQQLRFQITRTGEMLQQEFGRLATSDEIAQALDIDADKVERVLRNSHIFQVESVDTGTEEDEEGNTGTRWERVMEAEPQAIDRAENRIVLRQAIAKLGKLQRTVVVYFFYQDMTKTEIARKLGISVNYASYLVKRAAKNLRHVLEETGGAAHRAEITQQLTEFEQRARQAETLDVETTLPTAASFHQELNREVARARRYPQEFSLLLFQVVGWEKVAPSLSQREVESTLRQFAGVLRHSTRSVDKLFRYDDRQFIALLPHTGASGRNVGERVQRLVQQTPLQRAAGQPLPELSIIYRFAVFQAGDTPEELLHSLLREEGEEKKDAPKIKRQTRKLAGGRQKSRV